MPFCGRNEIIPSLGANGKVHGLESFGFSAPYKVLDEKLGYTPQNIHQEVVDFLKSND